MVKFILVMALLAGLMLAVVPAQAESWDLSASWNTATPAQMGQFTATDTGYIGQTPRFTDVLMDTTGVVGGGLDYWYHNNDYSYTEIYKNVTNAATNMYGVFEYNAGELGFVSYGRGHGWLEQTIKFSWIAPRDMDVVVSGYLSGISHSSYYANNQHAVQLQVVNGETELFRDAIIGYRGINGVGAFGDKPTTTFTSGITHVLANQTIDYYVWQYDDANIMHPGGQYNSHAFTAGNMVVTEVVPEPGSMLALGSGLVGMLGFVIRRRRA